MIQQSGHIFILQENAAGGELITAPIQPHSSLVIGKHRKQTWTASSGLNKANSRPHCGVVIYCLGPQNYGLCCFADKVNLRLFQSPLKGTICTQWWLSWALSWWSCCWQCFSFSRVCVSVSFYEWQQSIGLTSTSKQTTLHYSLTQSTIWM